MKTSTCLIWRWFSYSLVWGSPQRISANLSDDTYVTLGSAGANNPTAISMFAQDSTGICTTQIAYIQFNAGTIGTVTSASLVLTEGATAIGLDGAPAPILTPYGVADFDSLLSSTNAPKTTDSGVVVIQSQSMPLSAIARGNKLTWGASDPGLMTTSKAD